mgnify:CR=1 FL=1
MKKLLYVAVALFGLVAGQAMAGRTDVVIFRWPTGSSNASSATAMVDESAADGTVQLNVKMRQGSTVFDSALDFAVYGVTGYVASATPFFDNKFVIPFSAMGLTPAKVRKIVVTTIDGSATDYNFVSFTANQGGASAAAAYFGKPLMVGGAAGAIWQGDRKKEYLMSKGAESYGTLYIASPLAAADGICTFGIEVYGTK